MRSGMVEKQGSVVAYLKSNIRSWHGPSSDAAQKLKAARSRGLIGCLPLPQDVKHKLHVDCPLPPPPRLYITMVKMAQYHSVGLFGGAITASLPSTYADVRSATNSTMKETHLTHDSEIRQVPDNQEVYLDTNGFASIVVDILERVEKPDTEALQYHLHDIVEEDAGETKVWSTAEAHLAKLP